MAELTIKMLGGLAFQLGRDEFRPSTRKAAALLAYLALSPRGARSRAQLAAILWSRSADEQSRASLRQTLSSLRRALADDSRLLISDTESVALDRDLVAVDALEFEALADTDDAADLERAAELYSGEILEGFDLREIEFEEWLAFTRQQYHERAMRVFGRLADESRGRREFESALRYAQRLLTLDPLREQTHRMLMELYAGLGRREQALIQYDECERILKKELGVEPGAEMHAFYAAIRSGKVPGPAARNARDSTAAPPAPAAAQRPASDRPVIVVLPFENLGDDPGQDYFSSGITEDIITELSRFRSLAVIARSTSTSIRERGTDLPGLASQLGVDYVVEGSVRRADDTIRITAKLSAAASGEQIWAHRYDREIEAIFSVQDEVTRSIVATVGGRLEDHIVRSGAGRSRNWSVYEMILRAQAKHYSILKNGNREALAILEQACEQDPGNARVHSLIGAVLLLDYTMNWAVAPARTLDLALEHGREAIRLDSLDSLAHARLGETLIHYSKFDEARRHFDKALELNPNDAESRALYSLYWVAVGNTDRALEELETVRGIDPFDRVWIPWLRGETLFMAKRYAEAIADLEEVAEPINDLRLTLSACYACQGEASTARRLLHQYLLNARQEMPNFPGPALDDWIEHFRSSAGYHNEANHRLLTDAMEAIWPSEAEWSELKSECRAESPGGEMLEASSKPSIAVLPFRNLGDDAEQIYFSDGVTEEIITALSKFRWLLVISSNSSFRYRQEQTVNADIAAELDVRYVVTGSVQKHGDRVRVTAQLIDVATERHLWADRFDRRIDNIFDVQDEVAANIIGAVAPESLAAETRRATRVAERNLDAWDLIVRAHSHLRKLTKAHNEKAKQLLLKAIELDSDAAFAHSDLAFCYLFDSIFSWTRLHDIAVANAEAMARKAVLLDDRDALGYMALGWVAHKKRDQQGAEAAMHDAIQRNPSLADAYGYLAMIVGFAGKLDETRANVERALRLSPHDPMKTFWFDALATAAFNQGDYPLAVEWAEKAVEENPDYVGAQRVLAASYGQNGQLDKARSVVRAMLKLDPNLTCTETALGIPMRTSEYQERYVEGLRLAGLPE